MPAPSISGGGFTSLVTNGADRLYEMVALQQKAQLEAAARAEAARQQQVKEALESAKAGREAKQLYLAQLSEMRQGRALDNTEAQQEWERNNPSLMNVQTTDTEGNLVNALIGQRGGKEFGRMPGYRAPNNQWVDNIPGPDGKPRQELTDSNTGKVIASRGQWVKPPDPSSGNEGTWGPDVERVVNGRRVVGRYNNKNPGLFVEVPGMEMPDDPDKSPTEYQGKALFNYQFMQNGNALMDAAIAEGVPESDLLKIYALQKRSDVITNYTLSDAGKKFLEGAKLFVEGMGRSVSGAAITDPEWQRFRVMAVPLPGLTEELRHSKSSFRRLLEDTAAVQADRAYKQQYGKQYRSTQRPVTQMEIGPDGRLRPTQ